MAERIISTRIQKLWMAEEPLGRELGMSVVIIGGNDCMVRRYLDICSEFRCRAKVYTQMKDGLKNGVGSPDLLILFTGTASHKMVQTALRQSNAGRIVRCPSSSVAALRNVLQVHVG